MSCPRSRPLCLVRQDKLTWSKELLLIWGSSGGHYCRGLGEREGTARHSSQAASPGPHQPRMPQGLVGSGGRGRGGDYLSPEHPSSLAPINYLSRWVLNQGSSPSRRR